jgi:hypothetical protein
MDEKELDHLLHDAAKNWRVPVDPPLDEIWSAVEAEVFRSPVARRSPGWGMVGIAAAAALVVGVFGGGALAHRGVIPPLTNTTTGLPGVVASVTETNDPNQRAMGELLGRTAVLLAALPGDSAASKIGPQLSVEGAHLLTTTRMLLDSPVGSDPRLRSLLQDLELVLAQVARLEPKHRKNEMQFIQTALDEHDIVPRLRSAAADLSLNEF